MIKIKNLAWASVVSTVLIAVLYSGNIDEARGSARFRMHSALRTDYSGGQDYAYGESQYYTTATSDLASISRERPSTLAN